MSDTILIVGGGQAGAQAIDSLRRGGYSGRLVLIAEEPMLPYQRPPLSKKYLAGEMAAERLLFRHATYYTEHAVELKLNTRVRRLHPASRSVDLSDGEKLSYDRLLLATGARARTLTCPGSALNRVHALRNIADVDAIRENLRPKARVVIIGGGYIGLETAATAAKLGCEVTILEMADRAMNRVVAPVVSDFFMREHRAQGVRIVCGAQVASLEGGADVEHVRCLDGSRHAADVVVVGVGAVPNVELANEAGIFCDNGIAVDEYCRTSDENVFAAGDCCAQISARHGRRVRLESVDNAFEQAKTAALNMLDTPTVHDKVPWFWSDQFDLKLLIVGLSQGHDHVVVRGDPASRSFSVAYLKGAELLALDTINHAKDYMAGRKLIAERATMNLDRLADSAVALKDAT